MALHIPTEIIKNALSWSRYRDANPVPTSPLADDLAIRPIQFSLINGYMVQAQWPIDGDRCQMNNASGLYYNTVVSFLLYHWVKILWLVFYCTTGFNSHCTTGICHPLNHLGQSLIVPIAGLLLTFIHPFIHCTT